MIIHTGILAAPLLLAAWALDMYLFLCSVRLASGLLRHPAAAKVRAALQPLTDPLSEALSRRLSARFGRPLRGWVPWLLVFLMGMVLRQLLLWAALAAA